MAITVKHKFVSAIPDAGDTTIVQPSNWNDDHQLTGTVPVANGGTGASTLTGYLIGNGTSAVTASSTIPSGDVSGLGTMATQNANAIAVTGGTVNGTAIGATTASNGAFTYFSTSSTTNTTPVLNYNASNCNFAVGATIPNSYLQAVMQNKSGTATASTNWAVSNDLGTDSSYYGEFGMNSSAFSTGTPSDYFSLNNGIYFSGHDGDITIGSGNGFKTYLAWGTAGQNAHVINATGAIGLNTNITGTSNFGSAGQVLTSQGSSATPTWTSISGTGTVTSVGLTAPSIFTVTGSPVTSSGTLALAYSGTALPIANGGTNSTATPTAGGAIYGTGTAYAITAAGTAGAVLTSNGTSAPTWSTTAGVNQSDVGTAPNQIPLNQYLGNMAYQDKAGVNITGGAFNGTVGATTASTGAFTTVNGTQYIVPTSVLTATTQGSFAVGTLSYSDTGRLATYQASTNDYIQTEIQNTNAGASASSDHIVGNNNTTATTFYGDFGMNSSGWVGVAGTSSFNAPNMVYLTSTSSDLAIGTTTANIVRFSINGGADIAQITSTGLNSAPIGATTASTGIFTQLTVNGSNLNTAISPTGTGTVTIAPAGALTINPTAASTIDNASVGATTASTGRFTGVTVTAGTASVAPIKLTSGTNLTTAAAGAFEYDGSSFYSSIAASTRGVLATEQMVVLNTTYTLTSQTAAQKLFNNTTNGAVTLPIGTYQFECCYSLSSMSATSGSFGFAMVAGTAVIGSQGWNAVSQKVTALNGQNSASVATYNTAANTTLSATNTSTSGYAFIRGIIKITTAGTVIPSVSLTQAAAAVVGINSYFKISPITGASAANITVGNWS